MSLLPARYRFTRADAVYYAFIITIALIFISVIVFWACSAPGEETVQVLDRWWVCETRVKYTSVVIDVDSKGNVSSTTETRTRCDTAVAERDLPVVCPPEPCRMHEHDYVDYYVAYVIRYRILEKEAEHQRQFAPALWNVLEPDSLVEVEWGYSGVIDSAARTQKGAK